MLVRVLRKGRYCEYLIDEEDFELFKSRKWHDTGKGYLRTYHRGRYYLFHRVVMNCEKGLVVDHKDGDTYNNQKSNLRVCTVQQNTMNQRRRKNGSSQYKGVFFDKKKNKWRSTITFERKKIQIGYFIDEHEAARAYNTFAKAVFGEFAFLNEVKDF